MKQEVRMHVDTSGCLLSDWLIDAINRGYHIDQVIPHPSYFNPNTIMYTIIIHKL